MFTDGIDRMKETLQNLNGVIGVIAIHRYPGINKDHIGYFGNKMVFQCDKEPFCQYCNKNHIQWEYSDEYKYYIEIDGNIYFTLGDS